MSSNAITVTVIKEFTFDGDGVGHDASKEIAKLEKQGFRVLAPSSISQLRPVREVVPPSGESHLVRQIIDRTGCSRAALAAAVGVHRATVVRWEEGGAHARKRGIARLQEAHRLATESPATFVRTARAALAVKGEREPAPAPAPVEAKPSPTKSRPWTRLTDSRKLEIAVSYEDGATYAELAEKYGVSVRRITEVIREVAS